ncbi:MAG: SOS response-associated peptidase, partial [Thiobacillaceae bacterium]|nr:SOS response-associated peptidase [Thiobacillaceae bacterium]
APSQDIAAVREGAGGRELVLLRWGLIPAWAKEVKPAYSLLNARAESVASKPAYRDAFRRRRCLIPADGFYEWRQEGSGRQPYRFTLADGGLFAMAGLWARWCGPGGVVIESCTILVTAANELVRTIHDRMPVIIDPADYSLWLDPRLADPRSLEHLLRPYPAERMRAYPVSRRVNRADYDVPEAIEPL